jgi:uncharacterized protein (TIGR02453 family)
MTKDLFGFLKDLRSHNDRAWFNSNKERFEKSVKDPLEQLIEAVAPRLPKPYKSGGKLSRIYRDTRFSKDKSPYKTELFIHFTHEKGREGATPAFYAHIEPGHTMVGGGVWQPEPQALKGIRDRIVAKPGEWKRARNGGELRGACTMSGESLKRVPKPYDPEHEFAEDLRRKDYGLHVEVSDAAFLKDPVGSLGDGIKAATPLLEFLCDALKLPS